MDNTYTCNHCQSTEGEIKSACTKCGYNNRTRNFEWIRVTLRQVSGNRVSMEQLVAIHASRTQKART